MLNGFGLVASLQNDVALRLERMPEHHAQGILVFDEEYGERGRQRTQPAGTAARRASSCMATMAF